MLSRIALDLIEPNKDQPRRFFDQAKLAELADSIFANGLIQPILVRPLGNSRYEIVAGERRWRAIKLLADEGRIDDFSILCHVRKMEIGQRDILAVIENLQRADITPMEEATAFGRFIDNGMTPEDLAKLLGTHPFKIKNRLALRGLDDQIKPLVDSGQITVWIAAIIAALPPRQQTGVVRQISAGRLKTVDEVKSAVSALQSAGSQSDMFPEAPRASEEDARVLSMLEQKIDQISRLAQAGFKDGECIAAQRVSPDRVTTMADALNVIRKHLSRMERDLRSSAASSNILALA